MATRGREGERGRMVRLLRGTYLRETESREGMLTPQECELLQEGRSLRPAGAVICCTAPSPSRKGAVL